MKKKYFIIDTKNFKTSSLIYFFGIIVLLANLVSCGEPVTPNEAKGRVIYYPVSEADGNEPNQFGLYRYSYKFDSLGKIAINPVNHTTSVAANGIVLFEYSNAITNKFWGRCVDGTLISVPFPSDTNEPTKKYEYLNQPRISLSYDGHHALYFVKQTPIGSSNPIEIEPKLIVFNCAEWKMTIVSIKDFVLNELQDLGINSVEPVGENILLNTDGSTAYFAVKGIKYESGIPNVKAVLLIEYANNVLTTKYKQMDNLSNPLQLYFLNTDNLTTVKDNVVYSLFLNGILVPNTSLNSSNLFSPKQKATASNGIVIWNDSGIQYITLESPDYNNQVVTFDAIDSKSGPHKHTPNKRLTLSPDGRVVIFAIQKLNSDVYDLFIINRDGSNLTMIRDGIYLGIPVISDPIEL